MGEEMLFLANQGAEVLRLDAVAFAWKQMGTSCESLPQVHLLVQAFNALARIAAPSLLFKSEAIVHPDEVAQYINPRECQISYNPLLMALLWEALATREVRLLQLSLQERFRIDPACAWVNYVRSHDDIGWTFADGDAARLGIDSVGHRRFLNDFYTGRFPGSFARGVPFQENPRTGDARISGTCASLAGLESALQAGDAAQIDHAIHRMLLLYGIVLSIGGIPLLYLGDELGTLNDYTYRADPVRQDDSRWVHRPYFDWTMASLRHDTSAVEGRVFAGLTHLIQLRKQDPALAGGEMEIIPTGNRSVLAYLRHQGGARLVVLANFSEFSQTMQAGVIQATIQGGQAIDRISGDTLTLDGELTLIPYRLLWLAPPA
jgi:amylosucrase